MRPISTDRPFTCASCEAVTPTHPVIHLGLPFCCAGCAAGGPCICSYDSEVPDALDAVPDALDGAYAIELADDECRLVGASR